MNINELTLGQVKEIKHLFGIGKCDTVQNGTQNGPWQVGKNYLVRTVTMTNSGRLTAVYPMELVFEDAAWIADTGRFHDNLRSCEFSEVEPFIDPVIIGRGAVIDATTIDKLPIKQK